MAIVTLAITGLGCRWSGEAGPLRGGLAVDDGGRSAGGAEAWVGIGGGAVDVSAANRTYGPLARIEIIESGMPNRLLWGQEMGIRNRNASPNLPGPYLRNLR